MDYTICDDCAGYILHDIGDRPEGLGTIMSWEFVPDWDLATGDGIEEFGTSYCDLCDTGLVGPRYPFTVVA